ncbi:MAG: hypothetical protein M1826_007253 [Phylliscum demangeonii]|nr:MAG: hypothetical protein M1826_007253 [Phylliscum demangeonii]
MRLSTHESDVERLGMENAVRTSVDSGGTDTTSGATRKRLIDSLLENEASEEDSSMIDSLEGDLAGEEGDAEDERHDSGPSQPDDPQVASQLFDSPLLTIDNPAPSRSLPASQEIPLRLLSDSQQSSQSVLRVQPTGPKLTYSQQRSYLSEASLMDELLLQQPLIAEGRTPGHARRRGAGGSGVSSLACSVPEEPDGADSSSASGIRNIHELRAAGRMKRYLDQFEGSLEDLDDRSVSGAFKRRSSLLELVTRLSTKPHSRRFLDLSLDRRLFHALAHEQDIVCGCMFAFLIVVLAREGLAVHACSHLCQQGAVQMLTRLLPSRADIVSIAPTMAPELAAGFAQVVAQSSIWTELPRCISPSLLALTTLEVMVNSGRDGGHASYPLSSDTIDVVLAVLAGIPALNGSPDLLSAGERLEVESGLSILEACSMSYAFLHASPRAEVFRTTLVKRWLLGITESCDARLKAIALLVLRLTLNITNIKSSRSGGILCSPDVVEALGRTISRGFGGSLARLQDVDEENEEEGFFSLDLLILALATMINLVESSSDIRDHFLDAGGEATALLDSLTHPFLRGLERTSEADCMEETHMNVALGYLSILLAHLCLHERLRPLICARMPRQTLEPIRRTALEFLHYHRQVDAQLAGGADYRGCRNDDAFTDRLQAVLERLEVVG